MTRDRADALFILSSQLTFPNRTRIAKLASNAGLPTLVPLREYVEAGFLPSLVQATRSIASKRRYMWIRS
jgi:hypothetical protein